jgi:hypothetical protein
MSVAPIQKATKEETFTGLAADFNLDKKVLALLLASPMESLEDLRFYFSNETEVESFLAKDSNLKDGDLRIQAARFRRAWVAIRSAALRRDAVTRESTLADFDDILEEGTLRDVKINFGGDIVSNTQPRSCHRTICYPGATAKSTGDFSRYSTSGTSER